jgi:MraZ protein
VARLGRILSGEEGLGLSDFFMSRFMPSLDAKRRVSLPAAYRDVIEKRAGARSAVLVAEHPDHPALRVYDPGHGKTLFESMQAKFAGELSADQEMWGMEMLSTLSECSLDANGRLVMSDDMITHTGIKDEVLCLGVGSHFLIWNPDTAIAKIDKNDVLKNYVASQRANRKERA